MDETLKAALEETEQAVNDAPHADEVIELEAQCFEDVDMGDYAEDVVDRWTTSHLLAACWGLMTDEQKKFALADAKVSINDEMTELWAEFAAENDDEEVTDSDAAE